MTWLNQNILYYTCKAFGLLPFSGNQKYLSFAYSAVVWTILMFHNFRINSVVYEKSQTNSIELKLWMKYLYILKNSGSHIFWPLHCSLTMLVAVYYVIFVRMMRERYEMVNSMLKNYMDNTEMNTKCIYPREADRLFNKLRCLAKEVKSYYATQIFFLVVETVAILISNVTTVSFHIVYSNKIPIQFHFIIVTYCLFRLIFLISVVKETHETAIITKQTVFTVHNAVMKSTNIVISKELDIMILNCWNQPIVFDVHGLFDMDYQLIHSILAAVATYVVVCVQIQLAIIEHATHTNLQ
ncbi:uncharacterized protein LOC126835618 isoform X1 [Adelges cooleyi]|uniref:uncharacterized protein LOC126835618 isoform X1 n=1 Tax=Adelges cooleyi TaxID=133065 RepID=UPI0021805EA2|nr:uncharacterized protein LOC126835618 isoform X1 [Adelges cooleyi]